MFRTLIFGLIFATILQIFAKINCGPLVSDVEREAVGKQLDFPNENEIPGETGPREGPSFPSVPRQIPGFPRRGTQSDGLINRIVNFFKNMLGLGTPTIGPDGEVDVGGTGGGSSGERGILSFIRRTFSGLINRFMSILGGNGVQTPVGVNPDAAEFPYQRPRLEPIRRN